MNPGVQVPGLGFLLGDWLKAENQAYYYRESLAVFYGTIPFYRGY